MCDADPVVLNVIETAVLWKAKHEDGQCSQLCTTFGAFLANKAQETLQFDVTVRFEVLPHYHEGSLNRDNML